MAKKEFTKRKTSDFRDTDLVAIWSHDGKQGYTPQITTYKELKDDIIAAVPSGGISSASVELSAAQILALNTTQVEIVPAPAAGIVILPIAAILDYTFVTTPYSGMSGALTIEGISTSGGLLSTVMMNGANASFIAAFEDAQDKILEAGALYIGADGAITAGNGTAKITVLYQEITL